MVPDDLVTVELLADREELAAGEEISLASAFDIAPGWHIYWENPGESGLPTEVELTVPAGFAAGEVRYPGPIRFESPGPVVSYGYKEQVLLSIPVTVPEPLTAESYEFAAKVHWLACREACVRGKAKVSLTLPAADTGPDPSVDPGADPAAQPVPPAPRHGQRFAEHARQLPLPWSALSGGTSRWDRQDDRARTLTLAAPGSLEMAFFPHTGSDLGIASTRADIGESQSTVIVEYDDGAATGVPKVVRGVVSLTDADGSTRFYDVAVPKPTS